MQQCLSFCNNHIQSIVQQEFQHTVSSNGNQTAELGQFSGMFGNHLSSSKPLIQSGTNSSSFANRQLDLQPVEDKLRAMISEQQAKFVDECLQPLLT